MSGLNRTMLQSSKLAPAEAEKYMALTMEKQSRANELRAKIANRFSAISTLPSAIAAVSALTKPTPLLLDNTGRQIDPLGNEFQVPKQTPTLKANIRAEKRELFRRAQLEVEQPAKPAPSADDADAPGYLDPRLSQRGAMRQRRQFKFHERGEFEQLANKQRAKAKLEKLQAEISQAAKNTGISSAVKLAMVAPKHETSDKEVPLMEWWDSVVLDGKDYDCLPSVSDDKTKVMDYGQTISNLVEHPIQLKPPDEAMQPQYIKVFLTKKEKKKIRRQNRKEAQKEKTEKVRLGLEPPPEPKSEFASSIFLRPPLIHDLNY
uniref:Pre-mRNA-splicing factor 3 domain-containing protein n=1 Tax=Plectus sambesii TaxID=2011161 RepID=A0A914VA59_9BILA